MYMQNTDIRKCDFIRQYLIRPVKKLKFNITVTGVLYVLVLPLEMLSAILRESLKLKSALMRN